MIREIVKDEVFLSQKSSPASKKDKKIIEDLKDTYEEWAYMCAGMAANMIGEKKNIILVNVGVAIEIMINPVILDKKEPYEAEESCLCLKSPHKTIRFNTITVRWRDEDFQQHIETFSGLTAQIIQHEIDHTKGIVI